MRLTELQPGETAEIVEVDVTSLRSYKPLVMGLVVGSKVTCIESLETAMELDLYGGTMAVSKDIAKHIIVEFADESMAD